MSYDHLVPYATVRQLEYLDAIKAHGSIRKAARSLGVAKSAIDNALDRLRRSAAIRGVAPEYDMTHAAPDPYIVNGASTYYDKDGKPKGQWVKISLDAQRAAELQREAIAALSEDVRGLAPMVKPPSHADADLLTVYPLGDPHIGMYAWAKEAGDDFDLEIAKRLTLGAIDRLVASSPQSGTALILPLGDVFHMNDQTNQTPAHRHQLDADGRFVKVLHVGIQTFRHAILRALEHHRHVVVRFVSGNHDPQAVWALAFSIAAYFDSEPRVTVDLSPAKHWFYRFGSVLIGSTHGDTAKHRDLLGIMAADRAEDWGRTKHRYWYTGHVHSSGVTELPGVLCESFRTLAAKDAYCAGTGYRAGRDMRAIVHHREHGEIERHRVDVGMLEPA